MKIKPFVLLFIAALVGCSNKTVETRTLDNPLKGEEAIYYYLPQTLLDIEVSCNQINYVPGPYAAFAQKYLGIAGVNTNEQVEYTIERVDIQTHSEADLSAIFAVYPSFRGYGNYLALTNQGLVLPVSRLPEGTNQTSIGRQPIKTTTPFTDLSTEPFIAVGKETFYGRSLRDSVYVRIPVQRNLTIEKNTDEKAREAADLIFSLRKKRLEFLSSDVEHPIGGDALKVIFDEMQRLETEYLSLFIGKYYYQKVTRTLTFTPKNKEGETAIIFRFSTSKGILPPSDLSGSPILIEIEQPSFPKGYERMKTSLDEISKKAKLNQFYYRIPATTNARIVDGKQIIASKRVNIYQLGVLTQIPMVYPEKD